MIFDLGNPFSISDFKNEDKSLEDMGVRNNNPSIPSEISRKCCKSSLVKSLYFVIAIKMNTTP